MSERIFVAGNDEDGGFLYTFDELSAFNEWLSARTGRAQEGGIDMSKLKKHDAGTRFTVDHYSDGYSTFAVIVGEEKSIETKTIIEEITLE